MEDSRYQIIVRFLQNELSQEETKQFIKWRNLLPENEEQFQEVKFLWEKAHLSAESIDISVDKEAALTKVHSQIKPTKVVSLNNNKRRRLLRWAAAAAILLLIGGGLGYDMLFNKAVIVNFATKEGEQKEVTLPDSSKVWLNENSSIFYASKPYRNYRIVTLSGDAIFEVTPDKTKPFTVTATDLSVTVLGTKFNVNSGVNNSPYVHVFHGKVKISPLNKKGEENNIILTKDMTAEFDKTKNKLALTNDLSLNHLFWETRTLIFKNQALEKVISEIESAYKVKIDLSNNKMLSCPFTGRFQDQNIDEVLEILEDLFGLQVNKQNSLTFKITGGSCN